MYILVNDIFCPEAQYNSIDVPQTRQAQARGQVFFGGLNPLPKTVEKFNFRLLPRHRFP